MSRIHLNDIQRALLGAIADVIDECGTASLAMAAERIGQNPDGLRGASQALLNHGLIGRIKPTITLLGAGWNALGRMPRSRLSGAQAEPEAAALPAEPPSLTDRIRELVSRLPRPATTHAIAEQLDAYEPSVGATLSKLARKGEIARYTSDGPTLYGPIERTEPSGAVDPPGVSSAGTDPAGDAGPGVVEPPPVADDQAPEGSACGNDDASRPMEAGGVGGALEGAPVEGLGGGAGAAADASASEGDPRRLRHPARRRLPAVDAAITQLELATVERLQTAIFAGGLRSVLGRVPEPHPMQLHVYVATGLEHAHRARLVGYALRAAGHKITYDWTTHGSVQGEGFQRLAEVAQAERDGVAVADLVIAILPGGRGTHVEIGMALGYGIPVALLIEDGCYDAECAFYSLPEIDRRGWTTLVELTDAAVGAAAVVAAGLEEGHVEGPDPFFDAPLPDGVPQAPMTSLASQVDTPVEATLRLELKQHVDALDEIRMTLANAGIAPTITDRGITTNLSTPAMVEVAVSVLSEARAGRRAAMLALQRIATAAGLPDGVELKARDVEELVEHITKRLAADPHSGTTVRTVLEAVSEASGFLLDWHADDAALVTQLPRLVDHLRALASKAAIVAHAERHGDSAQELVATLPALIELLLEYDVEVTETAAPGGPLVHAVRRALSVSQDRGVALATTDGVVGELLARCHDYAELAGALRAAASRVPSLAAAANDLEARIVVVRGAAAIVQAEVANA